MTTRFTYWKELGDMYKENSGMYLGFLNEYPDHWTQGETLDKLKENLRDLYQTFHQEDIPGIRREADLEVA